MQYVSIAECEERLFQLAIEFDVSQKTPRYELNRKGVKDLGGVLTRVQNTWYRTKIEKAAYLLTTITKGHFFLNGNKRIALLVTLDFLYKNNVRKHKSLTKGSYKKWFSAHFPKYKLENRQFKTVYGWAFYNICKAIADDTSMHFDDLKRVVEDFLDFSLRMRQ